MSEPVTPLNGASYVGYVHVKEVGPRGMITLRGNLGDTGLAATLKQATGINMPVTGGIIENGTKSVAWMSPDELLIMVSYDEVASTLENLSAGLVGVHHLLADVSHARAVFTLQGEHCREALAKLSPADLSPENFAMGQIRRTRLAQIPAAFWVSGDDTMDVVCFRSVAQYTFDLLKNASRTNSEIDYF